MSGIIRFIGPYGKPIVSMADLPSDLSTVSIIESRRTDRFNVKAWESNGHLEVSATRETVWEEIWPTCFDIPACVANMEKEREENREDRERANRERACKRAKKRVRRACKAMGATTLLTLTYQALEVDLARVKLDLKAFNRLVEKLIPGFCFVAAFEKQKRGAWHMHLAVRSLPQMLPAKGGVKVKSFNVLRGLWRAVTKDRGGALNVSRRGPSQRSAARIASYIAGYIAKDFADGDKWVNRYAIYGAASTGEDGKPLFDVPTELRLGLVNDAREAITLCVGLMRPGQEIVTMLYSRFGDTFYLATEGPA